MSGIEPIIDQLEDWADYLTVKHEQIIAEKESNITWLKQENAFLTKQCSDLMNKLERQREIVYTKQAEINELIRNVK